MSRLRQDVSDRLVRRRRMADEDVPEVRLQFAGEAVAGEVLTRRTTHAHATPLDALACATRISLMTVW